MKAPRLRHPNAPQRGHSRGGTHANHGNHGNKDGGTFIVLPALLAGLGRGGRRRPRHRD